MVKSAQKSCLGWLSGVAMMALVPAAGAAQITAGPSEQKVTFSGDASGLTVTDLDMLDFHTATDTTNPGVGGVWILNLGLTTGPETAGGLFAANPNAETFKYIAADGDEVDAAISISQVQDDTTTPKLYFAGTVSSVTGDAGFTSAFGPAGIAFDGDFIVNSLGVTLTNLVGSASATVSALEAVTSAVPVLDEPNSLALLGIGLGFFGLAAFNRRRAA